MRPAVSHAIMFARGFLRGRFIRRTLGTLGALLAFVGGVLVLVASVPSGAGASAVRLFPLVLGLGALLGAWWIHRGGKALLFPRIRLTAAGFLTAAIGALLFITGSGTEALLVLGGGIVALVATAL